MRFNNLKYKFVAKKHNKLIWIDKRIFIKYKLKKKDFILDVVRIKYNANINRVNFVLIKKVEIWIMFFMFANKA